MKLDSIAPSYYFVHKKCVKTLFKLKTILLLTDKIGIPLKKCNNFKTRTNLSFIGNFFYKL